MSELCPNCGMHCLNNTIFCTPPISGRHKHYDDLGIIEVATNDEGNPPVISLLLTRGQVALLKFWFESHRAEGRDGEADLEIYLALREWEATNGQEP